MIYQLNETKNPQLFENLANNVRSFNDAVLGFSETSQPLSCTVHDQQQLLVGGISGRTVYKHWIIEVLWVSETLRGQGIGRELMNRAEAMAKERGCIAAQVDTLSFQGLEFYTKQGFQVAGKIENFPASHDRYFMVKYF